MADSVGKISLDIDLRSSLDKEIKSASNVIGKNMSQSIQKSLDGQRKGIRKWFTDVFKFPKRQFDNQIKGARKSIEDNLKMPKKALEMPKQTFDMNPFVSESDLLSQTLNNVNQQIDLQQQKLEGLKQEYNQGLSEKTKHEIEQQNQVMAAAEHRIESLRIKLKELQFSYENAVSPDRKNKLLEEIAKTESQITTLISRSDNALHKINQLEDGLAGEKKNALRERIVRTEASLLSLGKRAEKIQKDMHGTEKGFQRVGRSAQKTEKPVRRLGSAFDGTRERMSNMTNSFTAGFRRIAKQVLIFAVMYKAIRSFQDYMSGAMKTNDQFMHSLNQVRTNLQVAFMPIFEVIMPALQAFMNWLAKATAYIAAFISAIFGKTYQESYKAAQGVNAAKNAMDGFGGSAKKAAKEAKQAHKQLAGFDEINTLSDPPDASAGSGAGGGGGAGGMAPLVPPDMDITGIQGKMDKLVAGMKKGFTDAFNVIKKGWQWTVDSFSPYFMNAWNSSIQPALMRWKGTFGSVFNDIVSLGEPLKNWANDHLVPFLGKGIEGAGNILEGFLDLSRTIFEDIWDSAFPFIDLFVTEGLPRYTEYAEGALEIMFEWLEMMQDIYMDLWQDVASPAMEKLSEITQDGLGILFDWWDEWGTDTIDNIKGTLSEFKDIWKDFGDNFLKPYVENMLDTLDEIWVGNLRDLLKNVGEFVGDLIKAGTDIYREFIAPVIKWLSKFLSPAFTVTFGIASNTVLTAVELISGVLSGLMRTISGIVDFIAGVFTGDWRRAWEGVKTAFKGVVDTLVAVIKAPLNNIIGLINSAIRGFNKIKIPKWVPGVGGKGINIPQIPRLAQGGIIDQPTIAMVGEDGGEVVMPLERNTGWINNLAGQITQQMGGSGVGNDEVITVLKQNNEILTQILVAILNSESEIIIKLQETELGRAVIKAINNLQTQTGKTLLKV